MDEIEGFKEYLGVAEEDRLNALNPPDKTPELFERFLPYAVALDVENAWAKRFAGVTALPHRLEDLGSRRGHRVWDNGVSTTPDSTISVLLSIAPGCTLLCGGKAKALPLDALVETARTRVRRVIAFGHAADRFGSAFRSVGIETWAAATVESAVATAFERMEPGEELLFSPAAASFDAYLNFRERALAFQRALPPPDSETAALAGSRRSR
jgi:UDP-N-acetylmuramoylalanine-D-glutamate ligase